MQEVHPICWKTTNRHFLEDFGSGDLQDQEIVTDTAKNSQTVYAEPLYQNNEDEPFQNSAQ